MDLQFLQLLADTKQTINNDDIKPRTLQNLCGNVLIHFAASLGKPIIIEYLLRLGISCSVEINNTTPIYQAVINGHANAVKVLVENDADVNKRYFNLPLIHLAVTKGYADVVKVLSWFGADMEFEEPSGHPVLYRAVKRGDFDTAAVFLDYGVSLCNSAGDTLYHIAISEDCVEAINCLADLGVDIDDYDCEMHTPLYTAALAGKLSLVELLLENNADLDARDHNGNSLLHIAAKEGETVAATILLQVGMDVNIRGNFWGWTPLHTAAKYEQLSMVHLLVDRNADVNATTHDGKTAYDIAKDNCDKVMCKYLSHILTK